MVPHISEVRIRNYKSIAQATVTLGPFTALVGPNGSGKSNFFDSLAFVQECLAESIELAFKNRGGINAVRRKSGGHPNNIQVELALQLSDWGTAKYGFTIVAGKSVRFGSRRNHASSALSWAQKPALRLRTAYSGERFAE